MSRRKRYDLEKERKEQTGETGAFEAAFKQIDLLEERAIYALVPIEFTAMDIISAVLDPKHLELLKAVCGLAKNIYTKQGILLKPYPARVALDLEDVGVYPFAEEVCVPLPETSPISVAVTGILELNKQYDKAREVVKFFNRKGTPGAARYYWPTMCSLLPAEHAIHKADGAKFRDIDGVGSMINTFRETSAIVAGSLLFPEIETKRNKVTLYYGNSKTVGII